MSAKGSDWDIIVDDADLKAIYTFVQERRKQIPKFPKVQAQIESFEQWYRNLGWWELRTDMPNVLAEARRRRNEINKTVEDVIPPDWIPADSENQAPGAGANLPAAAPEKPPLIPAKYKMVAVVTGVAITALAVLRKLRIL